MTTEAEEELAEKRRRAAAVQRKSLAEARHYERKNCAGNEMAKRKAKG
jgi:hypothetical protein